MVRGRFRSPGRARWTTVVAVVAAALVGSACGTSVSTTSATTAASNAVPRPSAPADPCPVAALPVVVSVDQWGDIVHQLAGACGEVTTIIAGSTADPHEYEPTPADNAAFAKAKVAVVNGLGYDAWATKAIDTVAPRPAVVNAGDAAGLHEGDNPHLWYGPEHVQKVAEAVTATLKQQLPAAGAYLDRQAAAWQQSMTPYLDEVKSLRSSFAGQTYGATESVFDDMAAAIGLQNLTPAGYRSAAANESDPSPGDLHAFQETLDNRAMKVLIVNRQTEGAVTEQLVSAAEQAQVPVVPVSETMPAGASSFVDWQLGQLQSLRRALAGSK